MCSEVDADPVGQGCGRYPRLALISAPISALCVMAFALMTPAAALPVFSLPTDPVKIQPFTAVELLEDSTGTLRIEDVSQPQFDARFQAATADSLNIGFTRSVWWIRFKLTNSSEQPRELFLRQSYPLIDHIEFYERGSDGTWLATSTGDRTPFATRPIAHRDFLFPLHLSPGSERDYYLRFESQGPIDISLALLSTDETIASVSEEQLAYGIYFGCVVMLLVWSGLVFLAMRDNAFFAYFVYVAAFGLYMLVNNGLAFQFLWPDSPRWANNALIVLLHVAAFLALQFSRVILRSREYIPKLDRVAQGLQLVFLASLLLAPLVGYARIVVPLTGLIMVAVIYMIVLGTVSMLAGSRPARFYLLAWGSFLIGSIVFVLKNFGVVPHTFLSQNGWQLGSLLEMILLSMSLSSRMNELKNESRTDSLTRLGNRRLFDDTLAKEFASAKLQARPLSLLVLDIDHFKSYNDRHGHARGDEAIKAVGRVLQHHTHKPFIACRYGGEEFTVILPGTDAADAADLAERIRSTVQETLKGDLAITISAGIVSLSQANFSSEEEMFDAADLALYSAKQQGRNRVATFSKHHQRIKERRRAAEA